MPESSSVMHVRTKADWESLLAQGAKVLWEARYFKVILMPDGTLWRIMPMYRMGWPFEVPVAEEKIQEKEEDVDIKELI